MDRFVKPNKTEQTLINLLKDKFSLVQFHFHPQNPNASHGSGTSLSRWASFPLLNLMGYKKMQSDQYAEPDMQMQGNERWREKALRGRKIIAKVKNKRQNHRIQIMKWCSA